MNKVSMFCGAVLLSLCLSGCALVSHHTVPVEGGSKTTIGLFGLDVIDDCYPMLPIYVGVNRCK